MYVLVQMYVLYSSSKYFYFNEQLELDLLSLSCKDFAFVRFYIFVDNTTSF